MPNDQGPVVQSALLRQELIRLRKESGLTQEQVAQSLDWSPSKLIRVEGGRSSITKVDLDALLTMYGTTSESQRERLQAMNQGARERAWWSSYQDVEATAYKQYVEFATLNRTSIDTFMSPATASVSPGTASPAATVLDARVVVRRDCVRRGNTTRAPGAGRRMPANMYRDSACA